MRKQNILLTAWLLAPLAVLSIIMYGVAISLRNPPQKMQPVGAGAGHTGSDNSAFRVFGNQAVAGELPPLPPAGDGPNPSTQPDKVQPEFLPQGFVLIVEDKSKRATLDSPIYVAGSFNNWNPADPAFKLEPQSDMRWRIRMPQSTDGKPYEFKFTRGSWEIEELRSDMSAPGNRTLEKIDISTLPAGEQPKIEMVIPHWGDERPDFQLKQSLDPDRELDVTGDVRRLQVSGGIGGTIELLVFLPPSYNDASNAKKSYPVLYMHDGQNIFRKHAGIPAEWGLDETATDLMSKGAAADFIIVGIPHSGPTRISEYSPVELVKDAGSSGEAHLAWMKREVMPRVERAFRVAQGRENTAIGGASMGAVISIAACVRHSETFGMLYAESIPSVCNNVAWQSLVGGWERAPVRAYVGAGGREGSNDRTQREVLENTKAIIARLHELGVSESDVKLAIDDQAAHSEEAWAKRASTALRFLFPSVNGGVK
ncbi:MAG: alpha/beta hydrolase-fold protein [Phycisphaerales bacterium]